MKKQQGKEAFHQFFESVYGDRWTGIATALRDDDKKIARLNLFFSEADPLLLKVPGLMDAIPDLENCFEINEDFDQSHLESLLFPFYRMDPASLYPAKALAVEPGEKVLDMCAAPGGKTLILLEALTGAKGELDLTGKLVANELSPKRRHRMMSVFKRYLPKEVRSVVEIMSKDGSKIGLFKKEVFDRILLDAPCSGERGVFNKKSEIDSWKVKRTKSFGIRQYALLSSAFMALKPGGRIVYSTCSLSPHENDAVIEKLLKRKGSQVQILKDSKAGPGEATAHGTIFLPDQQGWGPIYYSVIEKQI